jgi:hypothetical protein
MRKTAVGESSAPGSSSRPVADLQCDRVSLGYRLRRNKAVEALAVWLQGREVRFASLLFCVEELNFELVHYLQYLYDRGSAVWLGRYAILGLQDLNRDLRGKLRPAWDSVFSWHRLEGTQSRIPMRLEVMQALCHFSVVAALVLEPSAAVEWLLFGVDLRQVSTLCSGRKKS